MIEGAYVVSVAAHMTFEKLSKIIEKYNIPKDVVLLSDSGWECSETEMQGVFYNREENKIIFTQYLGIKATNKDATWHGKLYERLYYDEEEAEVEE